MSDGRARLFVALELPDAVGAALTPWRDSLTRARDGLGHGAAASLRPVASEALHVTLCFLGLRSEDEIDAIAAACGVLASAPAPDLHLGMAMWLPARRPRVLAVRLHDPGASLARAQAMLADSLSAGGWYEPEARPYLAHVTVARVKAGRSDFGSPRPPDPPALPRLGFHASSAVLYRSRLSRGGARYEPLASVDLAPPGRA